MNFASLTLLAEQLAPWERNAQHFFQGGLQRTHTIFPVLGFSIAALGLGLLLVAVWGWRHKKQRHLRSTPMSVFHRVATQLDIDLTMQWLLVRIARQQALPSPLVLLMSGTTLNHHADRFADQLPARKRTVVLARIKVLGRILFGKDTP